MIKEIIYKLKCDKYILNIKTIIYKSYKKYFIITYKCFCNGKNQNFFYQVISANFLYESCNKFLC